MLLDASREGKDREVDRIMGKWNRNKHNYDDTDQVIINKRGVNLHTDVNTWFSFLLLLQLGWKDSSNSGI